MHRYEDKHLPIQEFSDADMLRFLLESKRISQTELARQSGVAESTISEILAQKRTLSRRHISALSRVFRVSPAVFFHKMVEEAVPEVKSVQRDIAGEN